MNQPESNARSLGVMNRQRLFTAILISNAGIRRRWRRIPEARVHLASTAFSVTDGNGREQYSLHFLVFGRFPFYPGYSADFFDGRHYVMKGGSSRTAACMLRRSFRNWFQPHYPYVYAGFRCVERQDAINPNTR